MVEANDSTDEPPTDEAGRLLEPLDIDCDHKGGDDYFCEECRPEIFGQAAKIGEAIEKGYSSGERIDVEDHDVEEARQEPSAEAPKHDEQDAD